MRMAEVSARAEQINQNHDQCTDLDRLCPECRVEFESWLDSLGANDPENYTEMRNV